MYVLVLKREIDLEIAKLSDPCIIFFMSKIDKLYITKRLQECRDPKDDKFLEVAVNGKANFIISGDQDLLVMNPSKDFKIVSPVENFII